MARRAKDPSPTYRNRVVELRYLKPGEIADHPHQWRLHPETQRAAIQGVLKEIGIAGVLLVYESAQNSGQVTAIDGHLRKSLDPSQPWPCIVLDVDDAESAYLLSTHDPLVALAQADQAKLAGLLADVQSGESAVQQMLSELAEQHGIGGDIGTDETEKDDSQMVRHTQSIKISLAVPEVAVIERALHATGIDNRGHALIAICMHYLTEPPDAGP